MKTLEERIDLAIVTSPYLADRRLSIQAVDDCVVLEGTVDTYFHKQMAQETLLRLDGVRRIENRVRVSSRAERRGLALGMST